MEKKRLKMSNRKFRAILIPILSIVVVLAIVANVACNLLASTLDTYVGKGETYISTPGSAKGLDGNYYNVLHAGSASSTEAAYAVAKRVAEEGSVLLKNNGTLPLAAGSAVMPFGYAYLHPIYGQLTSGGSAKWVVDPVTPEQGLSAFSIDTAAAERMTAAGDPEVIAEAAGTAAAGEAGSMLGGDCKIYEYDPSIYDGLASASDTTGIVFVTRSGQEGQDQKFDAYEDGTPHYLALTENEKGAIRAAKKACGRVVVILVASAPMELGVLMDGELEADAILWVGHPGERGFSTLSGLLSGAVNPSGRTVDIYPADFTADPTYQNIGVHTYSNLDVTKPGFTPGSGETYARMYTEYQEGVYMGYRYYETAGLMDDGFVYGELDGQGGFAAPGAVCYPFGYGLSYTTYDQELTSVTQRDGQVTAQVKVTNTGSTAGREVVQLYYTAPYTDIDIQNKIEKPVVNLIAFDKTDVLEPGASETVELTFAMEDMASYCYTHQNPDGTVGCYFLEDGDYVVSLRANSHDVIGEAVVTQDSAVWYDGSDDAHIRQSEKDAQSGMDAGGVLTGAPANPDASGWTNATNRFQTSSDYMNTDSVILSRADWAGTQPQTAPGRTKEISPQFAAQLGIETSFDVNTDPAFGNVAGSLVYAEQAPTSGAKNGLVLSQLRGLNYYDPKWDDLLDQIDWTGDQNGILMSFAGAAYATGAIDSIGLPPTVEMDGANGLKVGGMTEDGSGYDMSKSSSFGFAPLMAATWDTELIYEVGAAFGQESLQSGINGWYCPAINLHRSAFNGRVFEYYSEDPVLSGRLAAAVISGAGDQGMFCYVKHFALNDTDTGRDRLANFWADEQTMRELYLRSFEIAIKEARMTIRYYGEDGNLAEKTMRAATAVMPAQNCVGTTVGHANYALLTQVLRQEWGFQGMVVSDYWVWAENPLRDLCLRTGCDTYLCMFMPMMWNLVDYDSPTARSVMRTAIHNICYTVANSNTMQGMAPGAVIKTAMSPWMKMLVAADIVIGLLAAGGVVWIVLRARQERARPELFQRKAPKEARKA